jgi:hypothetical protein
MTAREIAARLDAGKLDVLAHLFPSGRVDGGEYCVGSLRGEAGDSLKIHLNGKGCVWQDFATGERGGDLLDLWAQARHGGDLRAAMRDAAGWLGLPPRDGHRVEQEDGPTDGLYDIPITHPTLGKASVAHIYHDPIGRVIGAALRWDRADGSKEIRPFDAVTGRFTFPTPRPLYRLEDLTEAPTAPVVIVEGEKCADALRPLLGPLGYVITTCWGGAESAGKADLSPLANRPQIILWPDADAAGRTYIETIARNLRELDPKATSFTVAVPDGVPAGWDVADAIADGVDVLELIEAARPFTDGSAPEPPLRVYSAREVLNLPAVPMRINDLGFPIRGLGAMVGQSGHGKGLVMEAMALSIARGRPLHSAMAVEPCPVVIIVAEGWGGIAGRQRAVYDLHRIPADEDVPLYYIAASPQLDDPEATEQVIQTIRVGAPGARVAFVDTYRATNSGDENDSTAAAKYVQGLKRIEEAIDGFVCTAAHVPWDGERERGSTAFRAAMDWVALVKKADDIVTVSCLKSKDGPEFTSLRWRIEPRADSATVVPIGAKEPDRSTPHTWRDTPENARKIISALAKDFDDDGATAVQLEKASAVKESSFFRVIKDVQKWGFVEKAGKRYVLTVAGREILS